MQDFLTYKGKEEPVNPDLRTYKRRLEVGNPGFTPYKTREENGPHLISSSFVILPNEVPFARMH